MLNNVNLIIHFCLNYYIMMCVGFTCIISTSSHVLIRRHDGGPHHDLPVSAAARQCRPATGFEPAV